ncbi:type I restriction-modification methylase [Helicobacter mustelae]|uniref:restriction endonuclease subunit S n=1 Tax=Helicobacter mustelae TaxID=217 RepID=UPI000E065E67|nr:restriction endonuclease subunit S [Helicobacter mustelae]STP11889.1 type I restriction-modification methylase [Helicobacter mustelae]
MNSVEKLLQTLCPHGVEFRKLGEVGEYIRGVTYRKSQEINGQGCGIKVLRANNITLSNHLNFEDIKTIDKSVKIRKEQYLKKNDILICAGSGSSEHIGKVAFIDANSDYVFGGFMGVIRIRELNSRFVYHVFTSNIFKQYLEKSLNTTTINNLNANVLQNFKIPLPPLEVQREIVKILDTFTELNTELNTELKLRKKQYEYYRNWLLSFSDVDASKEGAEQRLRDKSYPKALKALLLSLCPHGVEFRKLGEVGEFQNGRVMSKKNAVPGEVPVIAGGRQPAYYHNHANRIGETIAISSSGAYAGYVSYWNIPVFLSDSFSISPKKENLIPKYLFYWLQVKQDAIYATKSTGGIPHVYSKNLDNLPIPLPPLEVQREIVKILDDFSTLTEDLSSGIPAEIAARKKQYEYYRDKLLTFTPLIKEGE